MSLATIVKRWRVFCGVILLVWASSAWPSEATLSLLDNRFRVDPTIKQITFLVYRAKNSQPVVLVRPDGQKYYAWQTYDDVKWYQESDLDIISVDNPMPGPWQAVGKVTPKNNIKLVTDLQLYTDDFPANLYQGESLKFTARLLSNDKPLNLRDFLDRVNLKVTFTKYVENEDSLAKDAKPIPVVMGTFTDDGQGLDEYPGDGVFTVNLPIEIEPGKYRARITSQNGVFLRAQEQTVLVYPTPITATFVQARQAQNNHQISIRGEAGMIAKGSLLTHMETSGPNGYLDQKEGQAGSESLGINLTFANLDQPGEYHWQGKVFANDEATGRALSFELPSHSYSVVEEIDFSEIRAEQERIAEQEKQKALEDAIIAKRAKDRQQSLIYIAVGNVVVVILVLLVWFIVRKIRAKKTLKEELAFNTPE
ncbi:MULTISPECIES: TIGR03503 family protein [unclassified Vibrio]|uniref:TIGR03503 family protein n=1 Tax=Vibrio sp. HB236076 TaxID=3232307 RepID=A0AB39HI51_9VIBR|nr:TIGR03503 family protein [Vibrio sp. HB161653]MDP5254832.1 TIGR03503 family protein [Vibrio sp. HB161653]